MIPLDVGKHRCLVGQLELAARDRGNELGLIIHHPDVATAADIEEPDEGF